MTPIGRQGGRGQWSGSTGTGGGGAGHDHDPRSFTLTRDANDRVATVTIESDPAWVLSRNPDQSVASLTNTIHLVTLNRDGDGLLTGATVVEL